MDAGRKLVIRADAGPEIGTGHVMRCLALGQAWAKAGGHVAFVTACENPALLALLREEGFEIHEIDAAHPARQDWETLRQVLANHPGAWVITDGYHFDVTYHRLVKRSGHRLLAIDDMAHLDQYAADIVLNQNLHAKSLHYECEPGCRLLLGPPYVLLRQEFLEWRSFRREIPESADRILVTLGGVDPYDITVQVLRVLEAVRNGGLDIRVVVGSGNRRPDQLKAFVGQSPLPIQLEGDSASMSHLMAWADLAISAGGSTCWELAFMGLPGLVLSLSDNQLPIAEHLEREGVSINLGWYENLREEDVGRTVMALRGDAKRRGEMTRRGQQLVDGDGATRVIRCLDD